MNCTSASVNVLRKRILLPINYPARMRMKQAKKKVQKHIQILRARRDRTQSEQREKRFRDKSNSRFKVPKTGTSHGQRLLVGGHTITDKEAVKDAWAQHFMRLSSSKASESPALSNLDSFIHSYRLASFRNEDFVLDCDITTEEVRGIVKNLKRGKAGGPDNILPEHIIYGGDYLILWLKKIFNEILHLEQIPSCLKESIIVPIYKGKGKDPLLTNNYRGISLSSIISKVFERVILLRMTPILEEKGIPHRTQTAYQAGISCCDATEVVQEVVKAYINCGSMIFQCFYDLEKAFDSIEHNVLLNHLYKAGINGKAWRVIRAFYDKAESRVRVGSSLSGKFQLNRGVKQGSVLSPLLFLLVIDSLLAELESSGTGASIGGIYLGSLGHADDLRSITANIALLEEQAAVVKNFTHANGLQLNMEKLEFLPHSSSQTPSVESMAVGDSTISSSCSATCLGVTWSHDLSPSASISNNLAKARRAFFAQQANGIAYGKQNPLTSRELYSVCVLPVCLYGSESWLLTEPMLGKLEKFQGDLGKKILNIPKHYSNLIPLVALKWPTMRLQIIQRKLAFLWRTLHPTKITIYVSVFESLRNKGCVPLLIQQCKFLESVYGTHYTESLLSQSSNDGQSPLSLKDIRKALEEKDREYIWEQVSTRESLASLTPDVNWLRLWDDARDYGLQGARALMANLRILTTPKFENYSCQICGHKLDSKQFPADHIASIHLGCSADHLRDLLLDPSDETFTLPASLRTSLPSS